MSAGASRPLAVLSTARLLWACLLLAAPGRALRLMGGAQADVPQWRWVARTLGVRHVLQGAIQLRACITGLDPHPLLGAGVDALHGLSDAVLAATDRRRLRLATTDMVLATSCVMVEALAARRTGALR
jgi:hypothetical protein